MSYFEDALRVIAGNLQFANEKQQGIDPLSLGQIAEIAAVMASANPNPYDKEELLRLWTEALACVKARVDTVALAGAYREKMADFGLVRKECPSMQTIYYLRNRGSDGAFDQKADGMDL